MRTAQSSEYSLVPRHLDGRADCSPASVMNFVGHEYKKSAEMPILHELEYDE